MQTDKVVLAVLAVVALGAVVYLLYSTSQPTKAGFANMHPSTTMHKAKFENVEHFDNAPADQVSVSSGMQPVPTQTMLSVDASESIGMNEQPQGLQQPGPMQMNQLPSECYPKDVLSSADLLPRDANSLWAQVNPSGQGSLADQNFLTAGFHIGINTVGQSLRNANRQLRSEPANPQIAVSPWLNSTIEPDLMRQPLEIGCGSP